MPQIKKFTKAEFRRTVQKTLGDGWFGERILNSAYRKYEELFTHISNLSKKEPHELLILLQDFGGLRDQHFEKFMIHAPTEGVQIEKELAAYLAFKVICDEIMRFAFARVYSSSFAKR